MQLITPFLWFDNNAEEAMNFYVSIFKNSRVGRVTRYGEAGPGPAGTVLSFLRRAIGRTSDFLILSMSAHRSPVAAIRWAIVRNVKLFGPTSPLSTSSQEHGADTGAPGLARTV